MTPRTRRWDEPRDHGDGFRLLVCRYRPRGLRKADETWDEWWPQLGPSRELHAAYFGKAGAPLPWESYRERYVAEMAAQTFRLRALVSRMAAGETLTLLCSSSCLDARRCHRTVLAELLSKIAAAEPRRGAPRRP